MTDSATKKELEAMVDQYFRWLRSSTDVRIIKGIGEITTPFIDRHNDFLQIYVQKDKDQFILTDLGHTISDLEMCGCNIDTKSRQKLFQETIRSLGVDSDGNELFVRANSSDLPLRKHSLIQAMLSVNDLFFTSKGYVSTLFYEDVSNWLLKNNIRFSKRVSFLGKSGSTNSFDYLISASNKAPERIIKTINNPTKDSARSAVFSWIDIKDSRDDGTKFFTILNDSDQELAGSVINTLNAYDIGVIPWSKRSNHLEALAA